MRTDQNPNRLVRFRADPDKVRVGVRARGASGFTVSIASREFPSKCVEAFATSPRKALAKALRLADAAQIPGLDLATGWAYRHPWLAGEP
jgi:hypothetical protein